MNKTIVFKFYFPCVSLPLQFVLPYQKYGTVQAEEVQPPSTSGTAQEFLKSPSASPADFKNDGSPEGLSQSKSFYSEFGALQPELYAQKDDVLHTSLEQEHVKPKSRRGSLHTKLKYDFRTSDFVVKLIEGKTYTRSPSPSSSPIYIVGTSYFSKS